MSEKRLPSGGEGLDRWQLGLGSQDGKVQVGTFQSGASVQNLKGNGFEQGPRVAVRSGNGELARHDAGWAQLRHASAQ